jgi:hypothetical protein
VTETFTARLTVWLDPNQPVDTRNHPVADDVFTTSAGVTATTHSTYSFTGALVSGDPNGTNTHRWTFKGVPQVTRVSGGGIIARDAGNLVVDVTWDGREFESDLVDTRIVKDAGGHPDFNGDFCALMVPALGVG